MQYRTDKNGQELSMLGFGSRPVRPRADLAGPVQARAKTGKSKTGKHTLKTTLGGAPPE